MLQVIKKQGKTVKAYCLGTEHPMISRLINDGKIIPLGNGEFEILSQEAVLGGSGHGETAKAGDYIKLDNAGYPYPNDAVFFAKNHHHLSGDDYEQIPRALSAWTAGEPMCPEIEFLRRENLLHICEDDPERYFSAFLWGTLESAAKNAVLIFYETTKDAAGRITGITFNFVEIEEFKKTYDVI